MKAGNNMLTTPTVAIFGEVLVDVFPDQNILGGAPYNVARHLQAFGVHAEIISRIGMDRLGEALMDEMMALGLETQGMQFDTEYPTGQVKVHLQDGAHQFEILPDQAYDHINMAITQETMLTMQSDIKYFGTLALRNIESRLAAEQFLANAPCLKFLDLNLRAPWYTKVIIEFALRHADIVKMNDDELATVASYFELTGSPEQHARALQLQFKLRQIIITCGAKGSWLLNAQSQVVEPSELANPIEVIDTVGAGDAYAAVFLLGTLYKWDIPITIDRASIFAGAMCGVRGASAPAINFYQPFMEAWGISRHQLTN
jgi:fructokinase